MKPEERLFSAIGEADESLLARSEQTVSRRGGWTRTVRYLATAACLVLAVGVWLWSASISGYLPISRTEDPAATAPAQPGEDAAATPASPEMVAPQLEYEVPDPVLPGEDASPVLPDQEAPQLEYTGMFCLTKDLENDSGPMDMPAYSHYIDNSVGHDAYIVGDRREVHIYPLEDMPEDAPLCQLVIHYLSDCTLEEAVECQRESNESAYRSVKALDETSVELARPWPERAAGVCLLSSDGTAWNDRQAQDWFFEAGEGGVFVLTSKYFLEAEEGWGTHFHDMICSFRVENGELDPWKAALEDTVLALADAAFAGELDSTNPLLAENAVIERSLLDNLEPGDATLAGYAYGAQERGGRFVGSADVKFRMSEEDPWSVLTMLLSYKDGRWQVTRAAIRQKDGASFVFYEP